MVAKRVVVMATVLVVLEELLLGNVVVVTTVVVGTGAVQALATAEVETSSIYNTTNKRSK